MAGVSSVFFIAPICSGLSFVLYKTKRKNMNKITYFGDGQSMDFAFSFNFFQTSDIYVEINGIPQTSGYTLTCINSTTPADIPYVGGTITFDTAPKSTDCIKIYRKIEMSRVVDYQPMVKLDPDTLNQDANYLMEVIKDRKDEIDELHERYSDIADKESTSVLLARIDALNQQIENLERDIQNGKVMSKDDFYSHTTNCITEIPQDIKLELKDGVLTLKAGSKLYVPNGAGVFDVVTISADIQTASSGTYTGIALMFVRTDGFTLERIPINQVYSGSTQPSSDGYWYNTTNNKIYWINGGVLNERGTTLPVALVSTTNGLFDSIDKIFNGFGYIGSTIFALPGVKGQIPNGRNKDGTLKNTEIKTSSVLLYTDSSTSSNKYLLGETNIQRISDSNYFYNEEKNQIINKYDNSVVTKVLFATAGTINGVIYDFASKLPCSF